MRCQWESSSLSLSLQDEGYDRSLLRAGDPAPDRFTRLMLRFYRSLNKRTGLRIGMFETLKAHFMVVDQTHRDDTVAQIHCIVQKAG